jgi:hypothetical protein
MVLHTHIVLGMNNRLLFWSQFRDVVSPHRHDHHDQHDQQVCIVALSGPVVNVLVIGPKVHVFKSDRGRWIFKGYKSR